MKPSLKNMGRASIELGLAAFIVLFQEMTLIRWMSGQIRVLAYFPNLILISTFLGLGIGCLRAKHKSLLMLWPIALFLLTISTYILSRMVFTQNSSSEHLWLLYFDLPKGSPVLPYIEIPVICSFILATLCFVPLGQVIASRLDEFRRQADPLMGYIFDILGSLTGVICFVLVSSSNTFPVVWFAITLVFGFYFFTAQKKHAVIYGLLAVSVLSLVHFTEKSNAYSPYYALSRVTETPGESFIVLTNGSIHQKALNLQRQSGQTGYDKEILAGYHYPYRRLNHKPETALVLGAGTGNDVAVLLDEGVKHIDAVEIDPVILKWGKMFHPNKPYSSNQVSIHTTDARSYLKTTREKYDLIIFGTLDSMTRLSALSNVRLDNFVYTKESIAEAKNSLSPTGGIVLYFMAASDYIDQRLFALLSDAFGSTPVVHRKNHHLFNRIYMAGPAFEPKSNIEVSAPLKSQLSASPIEIPTDDWPFLYLKKRGLSLFYINIIIAILLLSIAGILLTLKLAPTGRPAKKLFDSQMFLFGLGFLLLETRSVTEMNLVWGATWITSAVVFGSILLMILFATLKERSRPFTYKQNYAGLILSLLVVYLLPVRLITGLAFWLKLSVSVIVIGLPIFFASSYFAKVYSRRQNIDLALGWNLLGAVTGGLLEFLSMVVGLKALVLIIIGAYLSAIFVSLVETSKQV